MSDEYPVFRFPKKDRPQSEPHPAHTRTHVLLFAVLGVSIALCLALLGTWLMFCL